MISNKNVILPYAWVAKFLKIPVFRLALGDDLVSRVVIFVHNFFSKLCQGQTSSIRNFDKTIAQRSTDRFQALGAVIDFVTPRDGKGRVQMMTFKAEALEQKLVSLGASWERRVVGGKEVFAIVPPKEPGEIWFQFKEKLNHFHWKEEEGMLITCDCANVIAPDSKTKCFLYAHSTSTSFASDWKRAGFYIGAKQDFCFFDNGNTWKNQGRAPSETSFYLEAEAVYNKIKDRYPLSDLWVGGSCGGAPVAAYLKRLFHDQGINFFAEQSFCDLDDFVKPISPFFAPFVKGSLEGGQLPKELVNPPKACQFGVAKMWENLPFYQEVKKGKIIFVQVREDEHLNEDAYARYLQLAKKVNTCVKHILYTSNAKWHHADDFFGYQAHRREFWQNVFD